MSPTQYPVASLVSHEGMTSFDFSRLRKSCIDQWQSAVCLLAIKNVEFDVECSVDIGVLIKSKLTLHRVECQSVTSAAGVICKLCLAAECRNGGERATSVNDGPRLY